jgi:transposase
MAKRTRRAFTPEFKAEVVLAILTGTQTTADLCRQHGLKPELVALWKKIFLDRAAAAFAGDTAGGREAARIAALERLVGQLTMELTIAKKASALLPLVLTSGGGS